MTRIEELRNGRARSPRNLLPVAVAGLALALAATGASGQGSGTPGRGIFLPFDQENGQWRICQGYFGQRSHDYDYAFDITINPDEPGAIGCTGLVNGSMGQPVYAPGAGTSTLRGGTGQFICLDLDVGGSLKIGHFDPGTRVGGEVGELDFLGSLDEANGANGNYAHIHIQAYTADDCEGDDVPFTGDYKFFGVPDLDDLGDTLVENDNHHTGTWLMSRMVDDGFDDAGGHYLDCAERIGFNEVYLGYCNAGSGIVSGLRFSNLDVAPDSHVTAASLVVKVDGPYTAYVDVRWQVENYEFAPPFSLVNPPSARQRLPVWQRWRVINDPWNLGETRETTNLNALLQDLVELPGWTQGANSIVFIATANTFASGSHRRFLAIERDNLADPVFYPARLVVTRFGNNPPIANAGPDQEYAFAGQAIDLYGGSSSDVEGGLEYSWKQVAGPTVTLHGSDSVSPRFRVIQPQAFYAFELTVTDEGRPGTGGESKMIDKDVVAVFCENCG